MGFRGAREGSVNFLCAASRDPKWKVACVGFCQSDSVIERLPDSWGPLLEGDLRTYLTQIY